MQMPLRARLLRVAFLVTAISLLLHAIRFDDAALPIALCMMFATLIYEVAYHIAIRQRDERQNDGRTVPF